MVTRAAARFVRDHAVVEELVQEASLTAFLSLRDLRDPGRFGPWFCGIVLNLCRSHVRRSYSGAPLAGTPLDRVASPGVVGHQASADSDPASILEEKELRARVLAAVSELPSTMRSATLLFYYREMSVREIAASLGITVGAVKVRLNRARRRLREQLREQLAEPELVGTGIGRPEMQKVYVADIVESEAESKFHGHEFSGHVVILAAEAGGRALPIWVGRDSGSAIALSARGTNFPRPQTFVFMQSILDAVGATVDRVTVERLDGDTFYAIVSVTGTHGIREIDARPSDAIALASRVNCPIFVSDEVMDQAGIDVPSGTAPGRGLDALVSEMEEHLQRPSHRACLTEDEKDEAYRKLAETMFGQE
ncbi:MAG: bifunctional nuclease family protein [Chloroflexi bacterium]|nr:bifunctional nuclease family protein [Chloroflexota bacterium]